MKSKSTKASLLASLFIASLSFAPTTFAQHKAWKEQKEKLVPVQQCRRVDKDAELDTDESLVRQGDTYQACKVVFVKPGEVVINDPPASEKTNSKKP